MTSAMPAEVSSVAKINTPKDAGFRKSSNAPKSQHQVEYERKMSEYDGRISYLKGKLDEMKGVPSGYANGVDGSTRGKLLDEIRKLREQAKPLQDQRRIWIKEATELRETLKKRSGELNAAKDKLPFKSVAEIDAKVASYESQLETGNFKLSEEKQIVAEIAKLNKARRALLSLDGNGNDVLSLKARLESIQEKLNSTDEQANSFKEKIETISAKINELDGVRSSEKVNKAERQVKIDKLRHEIDEVYESKRKLSEENRAQRQAAYEARLKRDARFKEERRIKEIEDKIADLDERLQSYNPESLLDKKFAECQSLINFFSQVSGVHAVEGSSQTNKTPATGPARTITLSEELAGAVLVKKEDDVFFAGAGSKKKGPKKASSSSNSQGESLGKLPIHILAGLGDLNLAIPSAQSQVPILLEALDKIKSALLAKKAAVQASGDEEPLDPKQKELVDQIAALKIELESKPEEVKAQE